MVSVKSNSVAERDSDKDEQEKFRGAFAKEPFDFPLKHPALLPEMVAEDNIATGSLFEVPPPEMESSSYAIATKGSLALENAAVAVNVAFDRHPHGKTSSQCKTATCVIHTSDVADVSETVCKTDIGANSVYDGSFARGTHTWQHRLYVGTICKSNTASNLVSVQSDCAKECFVPVSGPASDNFYENVMVSGAVARSEASQVSVSEHSRKFELPSVFRTPFGLKSGRFAEGGTPCTSDLLYLSQLSSRDAEEPRRAQSLVPMKRVYAPCSKQQLLARQSLEMHSLYKAVYQNKIHVQADTTNESSRIGWQRNDTVAVVRANFESPVPSDRCAIRKWRNDSPRFNNPNQIIPYVIRLRPPGQSPRQDHTVVPSGDMGRSSVLPPVEELIGTERRLSEPMYRAARSPYIVYANYSGKKC
ncbi:hypothetical protein TTRE_0000480601 [Trichuris trichiura]|uniref:Uncharacterized protein n=1 Tax=Trichuris trichiura TaxID=36087 RepID=A0A077Z8J0_TRITR|nr:hypothetical protein TTRE_0000480601 [Trichuris trichiura]